MAANGSMGLTRKQLVVSALCKHFAIDPKKIPGNIAGDEIGSSYLSILKSAKKEDKVNDELKVLKWITYAEEFPNDPQACIGALKELNETLVDRSVLLGNGYTPSAADVSVFAAVHSPGIGLSSSDRKKFQHVLRWEVYIQVHHIP